MTDAQEQGLRACPFCGVKAYLMPQDFVECGGCGVEMGGIHAEDAVDRWNTRTPDASSNDEMERELAENIMVAVRRENIDRFSSDESQDQFEALTLRPMIRAAIAAQVTK